MKHKIVIIHFLRYAQIMLKYFQYAYIFLNADAETNGASDEPKICYNGF